MKRQYNQKNKINDRSSKKNKILGKFAKINKMDSPYLSRGK